MVFPPRRAARAKAAGWTAMLASIIATLALAFVPSPYVVELPGPTFDALGSTESGPLIEIEGQETYETDGELRLLTVSLMGNPSNALTWVQVAEAYLSPSRSFLPIDLVYPPGTDVEQSNEQGQIEMQNSQSSAIAAALLHEGFEFEADVTVADIIPGLPAEGVLQAEDRILTVNGAPVYDAYSIRTAIAERGSGVASDVEFVRDGETQTVSLTPRDEDGALVIGVYLQNEFTFPFDVTIQLPNVGGPSAGMMFALGIIDSLTPGSLTNGEHWAGTGTITAQGDVGPIGGIVQKMYGARDAGAEYFLAPIANCNEVVGNIPSGLEVFEVTTLDDAILAIETVASGGDLSDLPRCAAVVP
ncbi:YlbL family protein [Humidisolicoccus flavus]|uniref:YlbL family protein n=1 Tax=Humidisolicoccus flavus TaxID=3111414 RepID=UPI0032509B5E